MHRCRFCAACLVTGGIRLLKRMEVGSRSFESVRSEENQMADKLLAVRFGMLPSAEHQACMAIPESTRIGESELAVIELVAMHM